ncbi:molybdopterin-dependent oxidoreductase [Dehalobacter sp. DCM]|uniref:molybdopterin-containing oxidoreductase family protein n=1 Tax=Dehalobacter sp. DCM TaxID=2907827 RepID=UPI003082033C|nr:molybdopterin-dependent oxidoreductase [Dehalobacter sp. DCM]
MSEERAISCRCHLCGSSHCGVSVYEKDGQITKVLPDPLWPGSAAYCARLNNQGKAAIEYHYHPDRLNFPMKRIGERGEGKWEIISWDQALDEVAAKLLEIRDKYGAEAVGGITGTAHYPDYTWPKTRFLNLFGSPNNLGNEQICHGPQTKAYETTLGWAGQLYMVPGLTKCIVLNSNQRESAPPTFAGVEAIKAGGAKVISINPRFSDVSRLSDEYLMLRPGTDGALYLAWLNVIINEELYDKEFVEKWVVGFEELKEFVQAWTPEKAAEITWLTADKIRESARIYATNKPARIIAMQSYDGQAPNGFRTLRAVAMLEAITGNVDESCFILGPYSNDKLVDDYEMELNELLPESQKKKQVGGDRFKVLGYVGWDMLGEYQKKRFNTKMYAYWSNQGHAPMVWRQILTEKPYPIKALTLTGCGALTKFSNPKLIYEAFKKLDLLVVADFFPNANTSLADYVFPMSDWMERMCLETSIAHLMGLLSGGLNAVEPMYERRSDYDFWRGLAVRCGQEEHWPQKTLEEVYDYRLSRQGMTFRQFVDEKLMDSGELEFHKYEQINPKTGEQFGFATPSGKVEFKSSLLEKMGYDSLTHYEEPNFSPISTPDYAKKYPYILITGARVQPFYHSEHRQIPSLRKMRPDPIVEMNPILAQSLEPPIADGDWAYIETHLGRIKMKAKLTTALNPNVVSADHNWWFPEKDANEPSLYGVWESNINVCLDDDPDICGPELGQYTNKNAMCNIYKA